MNIGNYKPDGNIMTVAEIKEIVNEGVDISELKEKVDSIDNNVTALNDAVGEIEEDLTGAIADLNETISDVSDNTSNISDLQALTERLLTTINSFEDIVFLSDEYSLSYPIFYGYVAGNKEVYARCPVNKIIDSTKNYTINTDSITSIVLRTPQGRTNIQKADFETAIKQFNLEASNNNKLHIALNTITGLTADMPVSIVLNGTLKILINEE